MRPQLKLPVHARDALEIDDVKLFVHICTRKTRDYGQEGMNPLHLASKYSTGTSIAQHCIKTMRINPNVKSRRSLSSALHYAAAAGNLPLIRLLVKSGASVNLPRRDRATPLLLAAKNGQTQAVELLLSKSADINIVDRRGWNPAHWACRIGCLTLFATLLGKGADYQQVSAEKENCLHLAMRSGNEALVEKIIGWFSFPSPPEEAAFFST